MSDEKPIPWAENTNAQIVLSRLQEGPASTIELQHAPIVHVARQIWELRHWYGQRIRTGRLLNGVALYQLLPPEAPKAPAPVSRPAFGDSELIRDMHRPIRRMRVA